MSLITGCPACGTMFRVVPDQLKISDGWVRCGHCQEVFDATAHLHAEQAVAPAEPTAPAASQAPPPAPTPAPAPAFDEGHVVAGSHVQPADQEPEATPADPAAAGSRAGPDVEVIEVASPYHESDFPSSRAPLVPTSVPASGFGYVASRYEHAESRPAGSEWIRPSFADSDPPEPPLRAPVTRREVEEVGFVRKARKQAFWRRPLVRFFLMLLALALAALLAAQFGLQERDRLAAQYPFLRPWLERLCEPLACRIGPPRRIESILIDNSGFTRVRGDTYRLSFTLKNQAAHAVAVPALQLTLTDTQDQPLLQRVLLPAELGAAPGPLAPAAEWSASVALSISQAGGARIAGYRLLAFYP